MTSDILTMGVEVPYRVVNEFLLGHRFVSALVYFAGAFAGTIVVSLLLGDESWRGAVFGVLYGLVFAGVMA